MRFCSLYSGSSGNCIYLEYKNTKLLIDSGVSGKKIAASLDSLGVAPEELQGILVTHEHSDHIASVGIMSRKSGAPVYANERTWGVMEGSLGKIAEGNVRTFENGQRFSIGDIVVEPFSTPHDAVDPVAYNFYLNDRKITLMTDCGYVSQEMFDAISGTETILLESNHDIEMLKNGSYPVYLKARIMGNNGHLSNKTAGNLLAHLVRQKTRRVMLGHLSLENNTPQTAYETVCSILQNAGVAVGSDLLLSVCSRTEVSGVV